MSVFKTYGGIINEVRDLHGAFGPQDNPSPVLRRFIARYSRELAAKIWDIAPSYFGQQGTANLVIEAVLAIPATQALFDAGIAISTGADIMFVREVWGQRSDDPGQTGQDRVEIVGRTRRSGINNRFPFCWIDGNLLFPGGRIEDWIAYNAIKLRYIAISGSGGIDTTPIVFQDDAADVIVAKLGEFAASRVGSLPGRIPVDLGYFKSKAEDAEASYLQRVGTGTKAQVERISEVW